MKTKTVVSYSNSGHKEGWALRSWCFWAVMLGKTLDSPLDSKEIKPVSPKGNQQWIFIGRMDAEAEAPILWPPDVKSQLLRKDPDAGKDWRQEEKGTTEDEFVGWHHQLEGHEFEQTPGDSAGQMGLVCYSPWGDRIGHDLVTEQQPKVVDFRWRKRFGGQLNEWNKRKELKMKRSSFPA